MDELAALRALSADVGADPLLVQAAGGNTSIKQDGLMWIKASGTWLKDAMARDILVPVELTPLHAALRANSPDCENCVAFVRGEYNPHGLRPSIETTMHAVLPHRVVLHVHCVNTIAIAIRKDAEVELRGKLSGLNWAYVPYARPGLPLTKAIQQRLKPVTDTLILGNHGLVVAADTIAAAEQKLRDVVERLTVNASTSPPPDFSRLEQLCSQAPYRLPEDIETHGLATDVAMLNCGKDVVFYPDHVVFLGVGVATDLASGENLVALPGVGVLIHKDAKPSVEPMGRCLADVMRRVPRDAELRTLSNDDIYLLTNWDAEKFRQK